jgi:hypothetical protein
MKKITGLIGVLAAIAVLAVGVGPANANAFTSKWGKFATQTYSGSGGEVIRLPKAIKAILLEADHDGEANFIVVARTARGSYNDLVFNEIGAYSGANAIGLESWDSKTRVLEVEADGNWTITLKPINKAKKFQSEGFGSQVMKYTAGFKAWRLSHDGESNFIINQHCTSGSSKLVVNEIGAYSGRKTLTAGRCVLVVYADGAWSLSR